MNLAFGLFGGGGSEHKPIDWRPLSFLLHLPLLNTQGITCPPLNAIDINRRRQSAECHGVEVSVRFNSRQLYGWRAKFEATSGRSDSFFFSQLIFVILGYLIHTAWRCSTYKEKERDKIRWTMTLMWGKKKIKRIYLGVWGINIRSMMKSSVRWRHHNDTIKPCLIKGSIPIKIPI